MELSEKWTCMELTTSMNSNLEKLKCIQAQIQNRNCPQIKIKQPKLTTKVLHRIDDIFWCTWYWQYLNGFKYWNDSNVNGLHHLKHQ